jgi:hypothetical protein
MKTTTERRAGMIERVKGILTAAEKHDALSWARAEISEMDAAGCFDDCHDVAIRAFAALERMAAGGSALR